MTQKNKKTERGEINAFPTDFITPNGRKFLSKLLAFLKMQYEGLRDEKGSLKEEKDKQCNSSEMQIMKSKIMDCESKLALPTYPVKEQKEICLPGNGVYIKLNGKPLRLVIDGVCICKHKLPEEYAIISANSPLGKSLIGKKAGETGTFVSNHIENHFEVVEIKFPSESKWIFKLDQEIKERIAV